VQDLSGPQIDELCERIEKAVGSFSLHVRADLRTRVGISAGSAVYGTDGESLDQLLISADQAMYNVKSAHKRETHLPASSQSPSAPDFAKAPHEVGADPLVTTAIN
jgi:GGDEF domain-containing protein